MSSLSGYNTGWSEWQNFAVSSHSDTAPVAKSNANSFGNFDSQANKQ